MKPVLRADELRDVLPVAAALAAEGRDSGLAFFVRIEAAIAELERDEDALARARRIAGK